ncbi:hypothetical protein B0I35DRAFT_198794 [Stachybotrys elegans]|uniref:3'(2'),5'-bisphosphate nucleotidase n=1 Tax=Stachybotrys elegans TaxID=80388 RepID=A0A8K0WT13_9HYPO|nr:hypothetical protein B0I35DRAFT_198794 [Stachybotrys elegans]
MESPYAKELGIAFGAVQNAAKLSRSVIASKDKGVVEKEDHSPVTVADFAIQALLTATLKDAFPEDTFVGEEDASALRSNAALREKVWELLVSLAGDDEAAASCKLPTSPDHMCDLIDQCGASTPGSGRAWVFDPIDGTQTYVRRELYAINCALLLDGKQEVGVVGAPNTSIDATGPIADRDVDPTGTGCIVFAVRGHGAYVRPLPGSIDQVQPRKLPRCDTTSLPDIKFLTSTTVESALVGVHDAVAERLGAAFPGCDVLPWVLRWAALALGLCNTTVWVYKKRDRYGKVWDHAGAMLLFEETGGKITDVHGKDIDLTIGRKMSGNYGFVAAPQQLHDLVLETVHQVLTDKGRVDLLM